MLSSIISTIPSSLTYFFFLTLAYAGATLTFVILGRLIPKPSIDTIAKPVDALIIPILNLLTAFFIAGLVIIAIGFNPFEALKYIFMGAFGYVNNIYEAIKALILGKMALKDFPFFEFTNFANTIYFTTNFIFAGLAVAIAFQARLFNIGGEGQALMGGVGATTIVLLLDHHLPGFILIPLAVIGAMITGGLWGLLAGWLQAYRNAHIVITTIMLNFIGSSVVVYLLANFMQAEGGAPETRRFLPSAQISSLNDWIYSPANLSFLLALFLCFFYWFYVWRTRWGYELRAIGKNEHASTYAGINYKKQILLVMAVSGAFAGLVAINTVLGSTHSLKNGFPAGAGFIGIAVALMGRNHPIGIIFAALLFGVMQQGGFELRFNMPGISNYVVSMLMGLVIFFSGALANQFTPIFMNSKNIATPKEKKTKKKELANA